MIVLIPESYLYRYDLIVHCGFFKEENDQREYLLVRSRNVQSKRQTETNLADVPGDSGKNY